jgi:CubicO group peptidase (beta-lactamase class C family)
MRPRVNVRAVSTAFTCSLALVTALSADERFGGAQHASIAPAIAAGPLLADFASADRPGAMLAGAHEEPSASHSSQQEEDPFAAIDSCVEAEMALTGTPGVSIAIATGGVITYTKAYGVKDAVDGGEIDPQTLFRIGSTTKMMTAAAVMQLVAEEKVDLHAPITRYLPELSLLPPWDPATITLHDLLTHTGGLPDAYYISDASTPLADWAGTLAGVPLWAPPGSFWNYSNPNFSLAGLVIQAVADMDFYDYMPARVWDPAGMPLTTLAPEDVLAHGNYAISHSGGQRLQPAAFDIPAVAPAGLAFSTPTEMVTWALLLAEGGGDVLTPDAVMAMQTPYLPLHYAPWMRYGYGIFVTNYQTLTEAGTPVTVFDHGGNVPGGSSQLYWIPEQGFAVSVLANSGQSMVRSAHCALSLLAGVRTIPFDGLETTPADWLPHAGTYSMLDYLLRPFTAHVTAAPATLDMVFSEPGRYPDPMLGRLVGPAMSLVPLFRDVFAVDDNGDGSPDVQLDYTFIRDDDDPNTTRYLRQRLIVGERVGTFPERISLDGSQCADLTITTDIDALNVTVSAAGISAVSKAALAISQDSPADPSTSSIKHRFTLDSPAQYMAIAVTATVSDVVGAYLMYDANADDDVDFPAEAVAVGNGSGHDMLVYLGEGAPAGTYELWVHGVAIATVESTVELTILAPRGDGLRLQNAPNSFVAGENHTLSVCQTGAVGGLRSGIGAIEFDYGSPPRSVRVLVDWIAAAGHKVFLPYAFRPPSQ